MEPAQLNDPTAWIRTARDQEPVFYMPRYDLWCVTRYEDVLEVFRDSVTYSNAEAHDLVVPMPQELRDEVGPEWEWPREGRVSITDPPEHRRLRRLLQPAFTPKRVADFSEQVFNLAEELLQAAKQRGRMHMLADFASPIPTRVIAAIVGIDPHAPEVAKFATWAASNAQLRFGPDMPHEEVMRCYRNLIEWRAYIADFVEKNRQQPGDNMTTDWMNATTAEGDRQLSDEELLAAIIGIQGAGSDTTANLITQSVYRLLRDGELWEQVVADPTLIPGLLEETLRYLGPVRGLVRTTKDDVQVGGVEIPAGSKVYLHLASANRDDRRFNAADDFDILRRDAKEHLAFGSGAHFCLGAPLARLEARIAIERLVAHFPNLRLTDTAQSLEFTNSMILPGIVDFEVEWAS